ncbi:hypothetical protein [Bacillus solitudinis]|nr:hypothetical protein [Bacillus solitudinis]
MEEQCFYCDDSIDDVYHGLFIHQNEHVDKSLCHDCYKDWLAGIKG